MHYVAHAFGIVRDVWTVNGVKKLRFTKDIREAMPFHTVEEANEALSGCTYGKHFCILSNFIQYIPKEATVPQVIEIAREVEVEPGLDMQIAEEMARLGIVGVFE